jgi:FKBP-type peptidyl-prolyl cis-trans isomerase SlpA
VDDKINLNSLVLLHYSIAMTTGAVVESSFEEEPIQITMGSGQLTDGMELAIIGLKEEDEQTLTLTPEQCFGFRDSDNIHDMPASEFPTDMKPEPGLSFSFGTPEGDEVPGTVRKVNDDHVEVDFNHPLAGQSLVFTVEILGVNNVRASISPE